MKKLDRDSLIGFVGAGTLGKSLAISLKKQGYPVVAVASRKISSAKILSKLVTGCVTYETANEAAQASDVVFITTSDDVIASVARSITWSHGQVVIHCSGAASLDTLQGAVVGNVIAGSFHPLQVFSSVENGVASIPGTTFGIEGNKELRQYLQEMAEALGGHPVFLSSENKPLYHLSGVMMGGLLTALASVAAQLWEQIGMSRDEGVKALAPMMRQVSINLESQGLPNSMAGPYVRGDIGTVSKHLEALREKAPEMLPLYCELALSGIPIAMERGILKKAKADEIIELLEQFKP